MTKQPTIEASTLSQHQTNLKPNFIKIEYFIFSHNINHTNYLLVLKPQQHDVEQTVPRVVGDFVQELGDDVGCHLATRWHIIVDQSGGNRDKHEPTLLLQYILQQKSKYLENEMLDWNR